MARRRIQVARVVRDDRAWSAGSDTVRIGELSQITGVSARSLRYYETLGLIQSTRTANGWRDFEGSMFDRVVLIQHLYAAGLSSSTIDEILPCLEAPADKRTGFLEHRLADEVERLEAAKHEIERELSVLRGLQSDGATLDGCH